MAALSLGRIFQAEEVAENLSDVFKDANVRSKDNCIKMNVQEITMEDLHRLEQRIYSLIPEGQSCSIVIKRSGTGLSIITTLGM